MMPKKNDEAATKQVTKYDRFAKVPENKKLPKLSSTLSSAYALQSEIETLEGLLNAKKLELLEYTTKTIPSMLKAANMNDFTTLDGIEVELGEFYSGSLPKDEAAKAKALALVKKLGGESLIKNKVAMNFGKGEGKLAKDALAALRKLGIKNIETGQDIHPQTLYKFCREVLEDGRQKLDVKDLGVFKGEKATIRVKQQAPKQV